MCLQKLTKSYDKLIAMHLITDTLIVVLCLFALAVGFVHYKKPPALTQVAGKPIGTLIAFSPLVEFKRNKDLYWQVVQTGMPFYENDSILTLENGHAVIKLENGETIEIAKNSGVTLNNFAAKRLQQFTINNLTLKNGQVRVQTGKEFWAFLPNGVLKFRAKAAQEDAELSLGFNVGKKAEIKLARGQGVFLKKDSDRLKKVVLKERQSLSVNLPEFENLSANTKALDEAEEIPISEGDIIDESGPTKTALKNSTLPQTTPRKPASVKDLIAKPKSVKSNTANKIAAIPKIDFAVDFPPNETEVSEKQITVRGHVTEPGAKISINGASTEIGGDLSFEKTVNLDPGSNQIVFQLIGPTGYSKFKNWTIIRK